MRDAYSNDPAERTYWPIRLPPRETTDLVLTMLAEGAGWRAINARTGVTSNRIGAMSANPAAWDTVDDEVAIERALQGDRSVLPALTLYERVKVRDALAERLEREPYEPAFDQEFRNRPVSSDHWLTILADCWGVDRRKLYNRLHRYTARMRAA